MARRWLQVRSATLMVLIALIASGLGGYRWYQDAVARRLLDRAGVLLRQIRPDTDLTRFETQLGAVSGGGAYQQVAFRNRVTGATTTVIIPMAAPSTDEEEGIALTPSPPPVGPARSRIGHFQPTK